MHRRGDSSHPSAEPPAAPDQVCQHEDSSHEEELHQQVVPRKGGRRPGPGKPLKLSKKGKEKRKGKGGMATIWQKMQVFREHERLVKAGTVKNPEKYMLQEKLFKWQFQGCMADSKWGASRKRHCWDAVCEYAPKVAKRVREVPNVLREALGIATLKHTRSRFPVRGKLHTLPTPLMLAVESLLLQRMELGEALDYRYVSGVVDLLTETWNTKVVELKEEVRQLNAPRILAAEDALFDDADDPDGEKAATRMAQAVRKALDDMQPIERSHHPQAIRSQIAKDIPCDGSIVYIVVVSYGLTFLCRNFCNRLCAKLGIKSSKVAAPGKHLPYDAVEMERVRVFVRLAPSRLGVHERLIANFDQAA